MPVVIPNGSEKLWTEQKKESNDLKALLPIMMDWSPEGWVSEEVNKNKFDQISFFNRTHIL